MTTRASQHAEPPDSAGHQGSFSRDDKLTEPSPNDLPGGTWESPRKDEAAPRRDWGPGLTLVLLVVGAGVVFAYCAAPHL